MTLSQIAAAFRTPQGAISCLVTIVTVLGTVGLLNAHLASALTTLLTAVLGVIMAVTHATVTTKLIQRAVSKAQKQPPNSTL